MLGGMRFDHAVRRLSRLLAKGVADGTVHRWADGKLHRKTPQGWVEVYTPRGHVGERFTTGHHEVEVTAADGDKVRVSERHGDHVGSGQWIPKASLRHFHDDLNGIVRSGHPDTAPHPAIKAVLKGEAEHLGKGDDGVVFRHGGKVVKVSTTVPFQPMNPGHLTPEAAANRLQHQANVSEHLRKLGVPGLVPIKTFRHGDKAFQVRDHVEIPEHLTQEHIDAVAHAMAEMHKRGWALNDEVQVGLHDGKPVLFDTGKAAPIRDTPQTMKGWRDTDADERRLDDLYKKHGHQNPKTKKKPPLLAAFAFDAALETGDFDTVFDAWNEATDAAKGTKILERINEKFDKFLAGQGELKKASSGGIYGGHMTMTVAGFRRWISDPHNAGRRIDLTKAGGKGPYIGPHGGKWADPQHTQSWRPDAQGHQDGKGAAHRLSGGQKGALLYALRNGMITRTTYGSSSGVTDSTGDLHEHGRVVTATIKKLEAMGLLEEDQSMRRGSPKAVPAGAFGRTAREGYASVQTSESVYKLTEAGARLANALRHAGLTKASIPAGALLLPLQHGRRAFFAQLFKGAGHKYIKRVPIPGKFTKKGGPRYRYFYHAATGGGVGSHEHMVKDAGFKADGGHWHIKAVDGDRLTVEHDETGESRTMTKAELAQKLHAEHKAAIDQHAKEKAERLERDRAEARQHGTDKHRQRLGLPTRAEEEAKKPMRAARKARDTKAEEAAPKPSLEGSVGKLEAVGDHIWGSRKDLASLGRIESSKQLEGMSYSDAAAIVTKAKLVTPLDLEDARALGMQPAVAHLFMHMLSTVRAKPDDTAASRAAFVDEIREIQGAMRRVKTIEDFKAMRSEMAAKWMAAPGYVVAQTSWKYGGTWDIASGRAEADRLTKETGIKHDLVGRGFQGLRIEAKAPRPFESLGTRFVNTLTGSTPGARKDFRKAADRALELARMGDDASWEALKTGPVGAQSKPSTEPKQKPNTDRGHSAAKSGSADVKRVGGRPVADANPARVRATFGLREVDFGQGGYMTQADREHHAKHLEGALHDLADALGLPPSQVSFNGRLGVALGARGRGKAAAHYEPGRAAINITKFAGGGALAHEWGHALDNIIASHYIKSAAGSAKGDAFLTRLPEHSALPVGLQVAVKAVHDAIHMPANEVEAAAGKRAAVAELTAERQRWGEAYAKAESVADRERFRHEYNRVTKRLNQVLRMPSTSAFFFEASVKDGSGKPYWSTSEELFARAFESYVHDKLAGQGRANTYLTDQRGAGSPGWYPQGEERKRINKAMDQLVAHLRTSGDLAKALRRLADLLAKANA